MHEQTEKLLTDYILAAAKRGTQIPRKKSVDAKKFATFRDNYGPTAARM